MSGFLLFAETAIIIPMNDASLFNLIPKILSAQKAETLSAEEILTLQEKRFRKLLRHAVRCSKFYRRLYGEQGITEENIDSVSAKDIPIIDKKILMEHFDELVCDERLKQKDLEAFIEHPENRGKKYHDSFQVIHTSGSSGRVGLFTYGADDWAQAKALAVARVSKGPVTFFRKTRLAFIGAIDGHYAGVSLVEDAPKFIFDVLPVSINGPLEEIVKKMNDFYPDVLTGYSSGIHLLAQEKIRGSIRISPKRIITSADTLTHEMRATIQKAFGVAPVNFYAASESLCLGAECDSAGSLHLFTDWHRTELLGSDGNAVQDGRAGNLVLTNLYNYTEPLIRYRMNDELILDTKKCPCGASFPVVKTIAGRTEDFLWFEDERGIADYLHPIVLAEFFVPGLRKFQFVQTGKNSLTMKAVLEKEGEKVKIIQEIKARMKKILEKKKLDASVVFVVEEVTDIQNDLKTGKFKLVIPFKK